MNADFVKLIFTYSAALIVIVGGGLMLFVMRLDPQDSVSANIQLVLAGFIGAAIQFLFGQESATRAARASERAYAVGLETPVPPTTP